MEKVGIREIKKMFSHYIRRVKMGETITITKRGIPVARLSPIHAKMPEGIFKMVDEGLASWQGGRPGRCKLSHKTNDQGKTLSEIISEDRR